MSLLGYLVPGIFQYFFYIPFFFQGIRLRWMIQDKNCSYFRIATILLFAPLALFIEFITTEEISTVNMHHFSIYMMLLIFALVLYFADIKKQLSNELTILYEAGLTFCAGYLLSPSSTGNPLYMNMHSFLTTAYSFVSVLMLLSYFSSLDLSSPSKRKRSSFLYILTGILLVIISTWFFRIGIAFNLHGDCGTEGCIALSDTTEEKSSVDGMDNMDGMNSMGGMDGMHGMRMMESMNMDMNNMNSSSNEMSMEEMEAAAMIPFFLVQHFLFSMATLFPVWIFLKKFEFLQEEEDLISPFGSNRVYGKISQNDDFGSIEMP